MMLDIILRHEFINASSNEDRNIEEGKVLFKGEGRKKVKHMKTTKNALRNVQFNMNETSVYASFFLHHPTFGEWALTL